MGDVGHELSACNKPAVVLNNTETPAYLNSSYGTGQVLEHSCQSGTYFDDGATSRQYTCIKDDRWSGLEADDPGCQ